MQGPVSSSSNQGFQVIGGGVTGDLFRSINWTQHPLGTPDNWPAALKITLSTMFHSQHPMFIWWGPELYQFYNDAYLPSFGVGKHPAAMGQKGEACWPEIWPAIKPQIDLVMSGQGSTWHQNQLLPIKRNGGLEDVYWTYGYSPIFNEDNSIGGTLVVCIETTEQVHAQKVLQENAQKYKDTQDQLVDIIENMSDSFFSVDKNWLITRVNAHMEKATNLKREDLIGKNFLEVFMNGHEFEQTQFWQMYHKTMNERVATHFHDYYEPYKIWADCRAFPQLGGGIAVFYSDITEKMRTESRLRNIFDTIPTFAGFLNDNGVVTFVNHAATSVIEASQTQVLGQTFWDCGWWNQLPDVQERIQRAHIQAMRGIAQRIDTQYMAIINGEAFIRWVDLSLFPMVGINGKIEDVTFTGFDITDRVEQAKELITAKAHAEAASQTKTAFLANMSHEIRTPLAAILGFTDILMNSEMANEERNQYLEIINRNGQSLTKIIDDILDLSKIEAGKLEIDNSALDLVQVTNEVIEMFNDRAIGKGVKLIFEDQGLPKFKVDSDPVRIRQVLVNLIGNAIKFTKVGSVRIFADYKALADDMLLINYYVKDTGIGLSAEQGERLFTPFNQADNHYNRKYGGTGLGLALSKKLGQALGGGVSLLESKEGVGCTFKFDLVAKKSSLSPKDVLQMPNTNFKDESKRLSGVKVLLVDDSPDNRELIEIILKRDGALVDLAENGERAVEMALSKTYDAVLMDIQMPGIDGYQAMAQLRSKNFRKPVLALTAHAMIEERNRALAFGFCDHITKPVNSAQLIQSIWTHTRQGLH